MRARYADGRAAVLQDVTCELAVGALTLHAASGSQTWECATLARADDGNGLIVLKRQPDTGERLIFEESDELPLRAAAPALFAAKAQGAEGPRTLAAIVAGAWAVAAAFLIGVPMAAEPIAEIMPPAYRNQIADISWSQVNTITQYCDDSDEAALVLNDLAYRMMSAANVRQRDDIWITIVDADFPNAFALPDDSIIVTDDLIAMAENPDELTGVIAHEIAHIEHNHIMKNIIRQMGAGIFFDIVFGGAGAGQAIAIASVNLAGLRFTRGDETDADTRGLDYLEASNINPGALAGFFDRIEEYARTQGASNIPTMLSTHPASSERAERARAHARPGAPPSLTPAQWQIVRQACGGGATAEPAAETPAQPQAAPPAKPADLEGGGKPSLRGRMDGLPSLRPRG